MAAISSSDLVVIVLGLVLATLYLFKDTLFAAKTKDTSIAGGKFSGQGGAADAAVDSRDFVAKLKATVRAFFTTTLFYGAMSLSAN